MKLRTLKESMLRANLNTTTVYVERPTANGHQEYELTITYDIEPGVPHPSVTITSVVDQRGTSWEPTPEEMQEFEQAAIDAEIKKSEMQQGKQDSHEDNQWRDRKLGM